MYNVDTKEELQNLLTKENIEREQYILFTVRNDDINQLNVFKSNLKDKELYCCDIISEDEEIINNYYYYNLDELIRTIIIDFEIED